jgi:hypothetical protein
MSYEEKKKTLTTKDILESIYNTQKQKMNYDPEQFITVTEIKYYFEFLVLNFVCDISFK